MSDLWSVFSRRRSTVRRARPERSSRLYLEALEERIVPAAYFDGTSYATIQGAVNAAAANPGPNNVITVDPGTYNEQVNVNTSVTIEGAQHGVAGQASSRANNPNDESVVTGVNGTTPFSITASNVTIDGFTVEGATNPNVFGMGVYIAQGVSGTDIQDNIIQDNIIGISLANGSGAQAVIQDNLIRDNNQPGPATGTGIYSDQYNAGGTLQNVLIANNVFSGNQTAGINLSSTDATKPASNITISENTFDSNGQALSLFSTVSSTIQNNTITNTNGGSSSAAIGLYGNDNQLTISNNLLQNGGQYGIQISNLLGAGAANSNIGINGNSISGFPTGLHLDSGAYTGSLNASGNFWGSATGPTDPTNAGGYGEKIDDAGQQVVFSPWLSSGANSSPSGQAGFTGNSGSLLSSNPTPPAPGPGPSPAPSPNPLPALQQQLLFDLSLAQGLQGDGLAQLQQQLSFWYSLAAMQSPQNASSLLLDEAMLTIDGLRWLNESMLRIDDPALVDTIEQLASAISNNPAAPTQAGQQIALLTGLVLLADLS